MEQYVTDTFYFDYHAEPIKRLIDAYQTTDLSPKEKAKAIYLNIRDGWRYNPYNITLNKEKYKASAIAQQPEGHCVDKAILLTACLRGVGIPARLRLAKVTNHIAVERLTERFGSNVLTPHGMVDVYLNGVWVKATPAFNKELCVLNKVAPLEFDGENDSVFQEYNGEGVKFMEYLEDYGHFNDVPVNFMVTNLQEHYPTIFSVHSNQIDYKF